MAPNMDTSSRREAIYMLMKAKNMFLSFVYHLNLEFIITAEALVFLLVPFSTTA